MLRKLFVAATAFLAWAGVASAQLAYAPVANDGSTGTIVGKLAKFTTAGNAITLLTTDTTWTGLVVGETVSTASPAITGNAILAIHGPASCIFDGTTVIGDYVTISGTVAGDCKDTGAATYPTSGAVVGIAMSVNSGAGTAATIYLIPPGGIAPTGVTAGAYTSSNITVGADGRLTAAANGSGGATLAPTMIAGRWVPLGGTGGNATANATSNNTTTYCYPGIAQGTFTISALGVYIQTGGSSNLQLAIYNSGAWGRPSTLIHATADIVDTATGAHSGTITNSALTNGTVYWLCEQVNDSTAAFRGISSNNFNNVTNMLGGSNLAGATFPTAVGVSTTSTYGTWPTWTSGTTWADDTGPASPIIVMLIASVP